MATEVLCLCFILHIFRHRLKENKTVGLRYDTSIEAKEMKEAYKQISRVRTFHLPNSKFRPVQSHPVADSTSESMFTSFADDPLAMTLTQHVRKETVFG